MSEAKHDASLLGVAEFAAEFLEELAVKLDGLAAQSRDYGWSTHQVTANESAANDCRRRAASLRRALAKPTGES